MFENLLHLKLMLYLFYAESWKLNYVNAVIHLHNFCEALMTSSQMLKKSCHIFFWKVAESLKLHFHLLITADDCVRRNGGKQQNSFVTRHLQRPSKHETSANGFCSYRTFKVTFSISTIILKSLIFVIFLKLWYHSRKKNAQRYRQ